MKEELEHLTNFGMLPWFDPSSEYPIHSFEWSDKWSDRAQNQFFFSMRHKACLGDEDSNSDSKDELCQNITNSESENSCYSFVLYKHF